MGCCRTGIIEKPNIPVGTTVVEICEIPPNATEGQMTFENHGTTDIALRLGQSKGSREVSYTNGLWTLLLPAGKSFSEEGLIKGTVIVVGSAVGGFFTAYISYS